MLQKHFEDLTNEVISIARQKRGSFSFNVDVAHIIDSILGLFRQKDTDKLKEKITALVVHTQHQDHRVSAIEGHISQLELSFSSLANVTFHAVWLANANHMESMFIFALGIVTDSQAVLLDLMTGKVPSQLFSLPALNVAFQNLTTVAKLNGYELAIHAPTEILRQKFDFFVNKTMLYFAFYLEVYNPNMEFKLLEHVNIPIISSNKSLMISTDKKYLGISEGLKEDRKSFSLSTLDFGHCKEFDETESRFLCGEVVIDKDISDSCLASLYIGDSTPCEIEPLDEPPSSDYYFLNDGTIILNFPETTELGYSCGIDNFTSFYVTGVYIPEIPPNCQITTDKWIINSDASSAISLSFENQSLLFDPEQLKPFEVGKEIDIPKFTPPPRTSVKPPPPQDEYYYGLNVSKDDFYQYVLICSFGLVLFCFITFFCIKTCIVNKLCCC